jgi:hypothetical protein
MQAVCRVALPHPYLTPRRGRTYYEGMTTFEEQLDELLALAADAGRLGAEYQQAEKLRDTALDRARAGRRARDAERAWTRAEQLLSSVRRKFLARHAGGSQ